MNYEKLQRGELLQLLKNRDAHIETLLESERAHRFKAAMAEWAVAGLMAKSLRLNMSVDPAHFKDANDVADVVRHLGDRAGHTFLREAERAFRLHAELAQLKRQVPPYYRDSFGDTAIPAPETWPRPFS